MYDEPPDPEPNPCPFCGEELGCGDGCEHCKMADEKAKAEGELSSLKHRLHCRARNLAVLPSMGGLTNRHMQGIAVILDLAGLKLPDHFMRAARCNVLGEYGEHTPFNVPDEQIAEEFMSMAIAADASARTGAFTGEMLDWRPHGTADQLWFGDDDEGMPRVWTHAEKLAGRHAGSTHWGLTVRELINEALESEAKGAAHWLEFYGEYLRQPQDLTPKKVHGYIKQTKVSYVVGQQAYTAYVGKHRTDYQSHGLGFGGSPFLVRLEDGREFYTDNNWGRGMVPPPLRKLLKANATFAPSEDIKAAEAKLAEAAA